MESLDNKEAIYDALFIELADCTQFTKAMTVMNHHSISQLAIKEALYIALAKWGEQKEYSCFIDACIKGLGHLTPQNTPALLTHIMIGGAYPYLVPALKLNFIRDEQDFTLSRCMLFGPDLRELEECKWCDFVEWVDNIKDGLGEEYYPGITIEQNGIKLQKLIKRKYLRNKGFSKLSRYENWKARKLNLSEWKKKFNYFSTHSNKQSNH